MNTSRTRFVQIISAALVSLLFTAGLVAVTAEPAAAASCWESTCVGRDPYIKGCSKNSHPTVYGYYGTVPVARVTNWYSANCDSNWAEGALTTAAKNTPNLGLSIYIHIYNDYFLEQN